MTAIDNSFDEIKGMIDQACNNALQSINIHLIQLYWNIGAFISDKLAVSQWGEKTIEQLADYLHRFGPDYTGFNRRNLYRMRQFYEAYAGNEIVSPLVTQLGWSHHLLILSKTKTVEEREYYIRLSIQERYTKRELERQLNSAMYERVMLSGQQHIERKLAHVAIHCRRISRNKSGANNETEIRFNPRLPA